MKKIILSLALLATGAVLLAGCGKAQPTPSVSTGTKVKFEKEVALNEEAMVEFQMMEGSEKTTGKATFKAKEFGEKAKMGETQPIAGQTFYYLVYDFKADATNSTTATPSLFLDPAAPQVVMLEANTMPELGGMISGAYNSNLQEEMGLQAFELVKMNQADWVSTVATWYTTKVEKPVVALQYNDASGSKKYIKINY